MLASLEQCSALGMLISCVLIACLIPYSIKCFQDQILDSFSIPLSIDNNINTRKLISGKPSQSVNNS